MEKVAHPAICSESLGVSTNMSDSGALHLPLYRAPAPFFLNLLRNLCTGHANVQAALTATTPLP